MTMLAAPDQALYDDLRGRPLITVPIRAPGGSQVLSGRPCLFVGWSLAETSGANVAYAEFMDGLDAKGTIAGEQLVGIGNVVPGITAQADVDASSANPAAANNVTLAGVGGNTTFITGFEITGTGATGASTIAVTVTGILGGTKTYDIAIPAGAAASITPLIVEYSRPIPASSIGVAIVVNVPSFGVGNLNAAVTAHGFQQSVLGGANNGLSTATNGPSPDAVLCRVGLFMRMGFGNVTGAVWIRV
jgi:hypothetical protein